MEKKKGRREPRRYLIKHGSEWKIRDPRFKAGFIFDYDMGPVRIESKVMQVTTAVGEFSDCIGYQGLPFKRKFVSNEHECSVLMAFHFVTANYTLSFM